MVVVFTCLEFSCFLTFQVSFYIFVFSQQFVTSVIHFLTLHFMSILFYDFMFLFLTFMCLSGCFDMSGAASLFFEILGLFLFLYLHINVLSLVSRLVSPCSFL